MYVKSKCEGGVSFALTDVLHFNLPFNTTKGQKKIVKLEYEKSRIASNMLTNFWLGALTLPKGVFSKRPNF